MNNAIEDCHQTFKSLQQREESILQTQSVHYPPSPPAQTNQLQHPNHRVSITDSSNFTAKIGKLRATALTPFPGAEGR